jgi:hypothetical protein
VKLDKDTAKAIMIFIKIEVQQDTFFSEFCTYLLILIHAKMFVHMFADRLDVREILVTTYFANRLQGDMRVRTSAAAHRHLNTGEDGDEHFLQGNKSVFTRKKTR